MRRPTPKLTISEQAERASLRSAIAHELGSKSGSALEASRQAYGHFKAIAAVRVTRRRGFSPELFIKANNELAAKAAPTKVFRSPAASST
ncbi:hypothetical protein Pstr01_06120 [Pseudomonas straminea]|nr:hypothetical protein Pstr01_06120 [Pseudomonas straminea]